MSHNTGLVDGLHRYLRISYGEMDDNNAATYMMQGSNYNDTRKPQGRTHQNASALLIFYAIRYKLSHYYIYL